MNTSEAISLYLEHYPQLNKERFFSTVDSEEIRDAVQALLDETISLPMEWGTKSLVEIGQEVRAVLHERHPELSEEALKRLGNYFTYQVK